MTPFRRMTLHLLQIGLTDDRTFMGLGCLFIAEDNSAFGEIVRTNFECYGVSFKNLDVIDSHFS